MINTNAVLLVVLFSLISRGESASNTLTIADIDLSKIQPVSQVPDRLSSGGTSADGVENLLACETVTNTNGVDEVMCRSVLHDMVNSSARSADADIILPPTPMPAWVYDVISSKPQFVKHVTVGSDANKQSSLQDDGFQQHGDLNVAPTGSTNTQPQILQFQTEEPTRDSPKQLPSGSENESAKDGDVKSTLGRILGMLEDIKGSDNSVQPSSTNTYTYEDYESTNNNNTNYYDDNNSEAPSYTTQYDDTATNDWQVTDGADTVINEDKPTGYDQIDAHATQIEKSSYKTTDPQDNLYDTSYTANYDDYYAQEDSAVYGNGSYKDIYGTDKEDARYYDYSTAQRNNDDHLFTADDGDGSNSANALAEAAVDATHSNNALNDAFTTDDQTDVDELLDALVKSLLASKNSELDDRKSDQPRLLSKRPPRQPSTDSAVSDMFGFADNNDGRAESVGARGRRPNAGHSAQRSQPTVRNRVTGSEQQIKTSPRRAQTRRRNAPERKRGLTGVGFASNAQPQTTLFNSPLKPSNLSPVRAPRDSSSQIQLAPVDTLKALEEVFNEILYGGQKRQTGIMQPVPRRPLPTLQQQTGLRYPNGFLVRDNNFLLRMQQSAQTGKTLTPATPLFPVSSVLYNPTLENSRISSTYIHPQGTFIPNAGQNPGVTYLSMPLPTVSPHGYPSAPQIPVRVPTGIAPISSLPVLLRPPVSSVQLQAQMSNSNSGAYPKRQKQTQSKPKRRILIKKRKKNPQTVNKPSVLHLDDNEENPFVVTAMKKRVKNAESARASRYKKPVNKDKSPEKDPWGFRDNPW